MNLNQALLVNTYKYNSSTGFLDRVGVIDNIISLTVEMKFGDFGTATLIMPYTTAQMYSAENADVFTVNIIASAKAAFIINSVQRIYSSSGDTVKITAEELKGLTKRRVELAKSPSYTEEDVTAAIKKIINDNIINPSNTDRKIIGYWDYPAPSITAEFTAPEQYDVCSASLRTICEEANCNYYANLGVLTGNTAANIIWTIANPVDRTINQTANTQFILTADRDYLTKATVDYDKHNIPTILVVSYDEDKTTYYTGKSGKGFNRFEAFVAAGAEDTTEKKAKAAGEEAYDEYSDDVVVKVTPSVKMLKDLFVNYNLGDIGTFIMDGITRDVQLTAVRLTFENGTVKSDYTFGYNKNTLTDTLRRLTRSSKNKNK